MFCDIRSCVSVAWLNTLLLHYTIISIASWLYKTDIKTYREQKKNKILILNFEIKVMYVFDVLNWQYSTIHKSRKLIRTTFLFSLRRTLTLI